MNLLVGLCVGLIFVSSCSARSLDAGFEDDDDFDLAQVESDPRLFFTNFTSSLIAVNSTTLAYALVFLAVLGAAGIALYYLFLESQSGSSGYSSYSNNAYNYQYARSSKSGYNFNALNIIQWISMLQDVYEKFDMNDLECQKRLVCEITREPEYFGTFSRSARSGFKYANTLAHMVTLPDDINELLDEYTDASNTGESSKKECEEYFQCPYSIKDSIKRNLVGNDL